MKRPTLLSMAPVVVMLAGSFCANAQSTSQLRPPQPLPLSTSGNLAPPIAIPPATPATNTPKVGGTFIGNSPLVATNI